MLRHINLFIVMVILQINYLRALEQEIEFADIIKGLKGQILKDNTENNGSSNPDDDVSLADLPKLEHHQNIQSSNTDDDITLADLPKLEHHQNKEGNEELDELVKDALAKLDKGRKKHKHDSNKIRIDDRYQNINKKLQTNYIKKNTKQELPYGLLNNAMQSPFIKLQAEKNQDLSSNTDNDDTVTVNKNKDEQLLNLVQAALSQLDSDNKNNKHEKENPRNDDRLQNRNKNNNVNKNNKQKSQSSSSKLQKLSGLEDYSKIYVILNPRAGLKKKEQKTVSHLLSEIIQSFTSAKKEDDLGLRRRNRVSDEDDEEIPKRSKRVEEPGVGGRTRLPFNRYRGDIYED